MDASVLWVPVDFILNIDQHLTTIVAQYGLWVYGVIFAIIFVETGVVIAPFLPGDSLIFASGALVALTEGSLSIGIVALLLPLAAILGDTTNYLIGHFFGSRILNRLEGRLIKSEHLAATTAFYERHGGKTIVLARFVPFMRTLAPFVAGIGRMEYRRFAIFNVIGGLLWTWLFLFLGYFFGNIGFVKDNFEWVILAIIAVSIAPLAIKAVKSHHEIRMKERAPLEEGV